LYSLTIWAKQKGKIFKSSDAGKSWIKQQLISEINGNDKIKAMFFKSKLNGWAIADFNDLFFTTADGTTWELNKYPLPQSPFSIASKSEKHFWLFGFMGSILRFEIGKN